MPGETELEYLSDIRDSEWYLGVSGDWAPVRASESTGKDGRAGLLRRASRAAWKARSV